ncbi:unnamed protein product, partial [Owenia fusiformis]
MDTEAPKSIESGDLSDTNTDKSKDVEKTVFVKLATDGEIDNPIAKDDTLQYTGRKAMEHMATELPAMEKWRLPSEADPDERRRTVGGAEAIYPSDKTGIETEFKKVWGGQTTGYWSGTVHDGAYSPQSQAWGARPKGDRYMPRTSTMITTPAELKLGTQERPVDREMKTHIHVMEDAINQNVTTINMMEGQVSNMEGHMSHIEGQVANMEGHMSNIGGEVTQIKDHIGTLSQTLKAEFKEEMNNLCQTLHMALQSSTSRPEPVLQ